MNDSVKLDLIASYRSEKLDQDLKTIFFNTIKQAIVNQKFVFVVECKSVPWGCFVLPGLDLLRNY